MDKPVSRGVIYKSELPWSKNDMIIRLILYYVLICTLLFLLQFGIGSILVQFSDLSQNYRETILFSITGILGIVLTWLFLWYDKRPVRQIGVFRPNNITILILITLITTPIALICGFIIENFSGVISFDQMLEDLITDPFVLVVMTLVTFLGIGVGEELIFRGYIQRLLESNTNFWNAAFISSVLFGVLHSFLRVADSLYAMIAVGVSATVFGLMFAYAYFKTGRNLFFPILIHSVWDLGIFIFDTEFIYDSVINVLFEIISQVFAALILIGVIYIYSEYFPAQKKVSEWKQGRLS